MLHEQRVEAEKDRPEAVEQDGEGTHTMVNQEKREMPLRKVLHVPDDQIIVEVEQETQGEGHEDPEQQPVPSMELLQEAEGLEPPGETFAARAPDRFSEHGRDVELPSRATCMVGPAKGCDSV